MLNQREREELESLKKQAKELKESCETDLDVSENLREIAIRLTHRTETRGMLASQIIVKIESLTTKQEKEKT